MPARSPLRKHFQDAWKKVIEGPYTHGLINSERGLQVHYCIALLEEFNATNSDRRLFIEPSVRIDGKKTRYPDLVVCNAKTVIGVVEFKYTPRKRPGIAKDFATLNALATATGTDVVEISNKRFLVKKSVTYKFPLATDAVLCWAGVYKGKKLELPPVEATSLGKRFLRLDALTAEGEDAVIIQD